MTNWTNRGVASGVKRVSAAQAKAQLSALMAEVAYTPLPFLEGGQK